MTLWIHHSSFACYDHQSASYCAVMWSLEDDWTVKQNMGFSRLGCGDFRRTDGRGALSNLAASSGRAGSLPPRSISHCQGTLTSARCVVAVEGRLCRRSKIRFPAFWQYLLLWRRYLGSCGLSGRQVSPQRGAAAFCARSPSFEAREVAAWRPRRLGCSHRR